MVAMFCTSFTSRSVPTRTSSSGLNRTDEPSAAAGSNLRLRLLSPSRRQPALSAQFSPLMSCTSTECGQESRVGRTSPTPLPERVGTDLEVKDVQNIATMIVDPDGRGLNDHWAKTGHALLVGTILHVLYAEHNKTLHGVASFLSDPTRNIEQTIEAMLQTAHDAEGTRHWHDSTGRPPRTRPEVAAAARELLNKSENARSGVLSTAMSFLGLYRDPTVALVTSTCGWRIADLVE